MIQEGLFCVLGVAANREDGVGRRTVFAVHMYCMKNCTIFSDAGPWLEEGAGKRTVLDCTLTA